MNLRPTRRTLVTLVFLNLLMVVPLGLYIRGIEFMRRNSDEYCLAVGARELGAAGNALFLYNTMDGKLVGRFITGLAASAGIPAAQVITIVMVILWWIVFFGIFRLIFRNRTYRNWQAALATSLFTVMLFVGLPRIERTLYSLNGTTYVFLATVLFAGSIWLILQPALKSTPLTFLILLLLGFLLYDVSDTVGIPALLVLASVYAGSFVRTEIPRVLRPRLLALLIGALIGLVSIWLAPGSQMRRALLGSTNIDFGYGLYAVFSGLGAAGTIAFVQAPLACLSLLGIAGIVGYCSPMMSTPELRQKARQAMLLSFLAGCILIAACFAPPNLMLHDALNDHAYTAPLSITLCLFIVWGYCIGVQLKKASTASDIPIAVQATVIALVGIIAVSGSQQALQTADGLRDYAQAWDKRDRAIHAAINAGLTSPFVGPLTNYYDSSIPINVGEKGSLHVAALYSPYRWDLTDDPTNWVNKCIAWYYGISAIVADP